MVFVSIFDSGSARSGGYGLDTHLPYEWAGISGICVTGRSTTKGVEQVQSFSGAGDSHVE